MLNNSGRGSGGAEGRLAGRSVGFRVFQRINYFQVRLDTSRGSPIGLRAPHLGAHAECDADDQGLISDSPRAHSFVGALDGFDQFLMEALADQFRLVIRNAFDVRDDGTIELVHEDRRIPGC
jgi:hypothetical protein